MLCPYTSNNILIRIVLSPSAFIGGYFPRFTV
jgi:hypothetical protein